MRTVRSVVCGLATMLAVCTLPMLGAAGCTTIRVTDPPRTASEQFLLSEAAARAIDQLSFEALRGREVYLDATHFAADAKEFVIGQVRGKLLNSGVPLVDSKKEAQIVMEIRSRGVGIDRYGSLIGVPPIPVGSRAAGGVALDSVLTPELAFYKNTKQHGFASIAYVAYWRDTGEVVASSGPFVGRTFREDTWVLGTGPQTVGNVPTAKHQVEE